MRAAPNDRRFRLERARYLQDDLASFRIAPALDEIRKNPARAFDPVQSLDLEAGVDDFTAQILGPMEICCREVIEPIRRVLMMPVDEVTLDDPGELAVAQQLAREPIEHRPPSRDSSGDEHAAGVRTRMSESAACRSRS